jgi:hypothetical protein
MTATLIPWLIPWTSPVGCKIYPLSVTEQGKLNEFLEENLKSGRIRPSKSPMASAFFFINKTAACDRSKIIGSSMR